MPQQTWLCGNFADVALSITSQRYGISKACYNYLVSIDIGKTIPDGDGEQLLWYDEEMRSFVTKRCATCQRFQTPLPESGLKLGLEL
jgi:hypothetical protein